MKRNGSRNGTDPRLEQLRATFAGELAERTQSLRDLLAALQAGASPVPDTVAALLREAHSLKGAARAVARAELERLLHACETALVRIRDAGRPAPIELANLTQAIELCEPLACVPSGPGQPAPDGWPAIL